MRPGNALPSGSNNTLSTGSCMKLSVRLLRKMLHDLGAAADNILDKETLARRVMAARILRQRQRQQARKSTIRSTSNWHSPNSKTSTRRPKAGARGGEQRSKPSERECEGLRATYQTNGLVHNLGNVSGKQRSERVCEGLRATRPMG